MDNEDEFDWANTTNRSEHEFRLNVKASMSIVANWLHWMFTIPDGDTGYEFGNVPTLRLLEDDTSLFGRGHSHDGLVFALVGIVPGSAQGRLRYLVQVAIDREDWHKRNPMGRPWQNLLVTDFACIDLVDLGSQTKVIYLPNQLDALRQAHQEVLGALRTDFEAVGDAAQLPAPWDIPGSTKQQRERRQQVYELRQSGYTIEQIAEKVRAGETTVKRDLATMGRN